MPHRLPTGGRIDRSRPLTFRFDGKTYRGFAGDTLASALMANGVILMGRSFKYHRPRGPIAAGAEEPNALVEAGEGTRHEPNLRATQVELCEGLTARSQNRWPSLAWDVGAVNSKLSRVFPAGFYYKTFMWPRSFWEKLYEPVIRRAAGLGTAPKERDGDTYEQMHAFADVTVAGGGVAGLAAALAAAEAGARVLLIEDQPVLGGRTPDDGGEIGGKPAADWIAETEAALRAHANVTILTRTTVVGHFDHNYLMAAERVGDHAPAPTAGAAPRHRLWKIRTRETVVAGGAIERPMIFANNDRPGVMLASAVRTFVARYGVSPGHRVVIFTNNDDAYRTALTLADAGVMVPLIVDARDGSDGDLVRQARERGLSIRFKAGIATALGTKAVTGVRVGTLRDSGRMGDPLETIDCDAVAMSGGWNPAVHLFSHCGGKLRFDEALAAFVPGETRERLTVCGAANGAMTLDATLADGAAKGHAAAARATGADAGKAPRPPRADAPREAPLAPIWFVPSLPPYAEGNKHFLDQQNDVTAADVELAAREGYRSVEHTKRYTTLGMATDQGKTSNIAGLGILADALGKPIPEVGTTTFRPPYTPYSFGAIAGRRAGALFHPIRKTPISDWANAHGADNEPVGDWRRPFCYRKAGETREQAVTREVRAVREAVGLLDASTLGKIEVRGPDAGELLDRVYTNMMSTLKSGRCRYGLMMNDNGFLWDDGVVARLGEDRFVLHTTSGNAGRVRAWLEEWLQTEWFDLKAYVTDVTEQWAQIAVAGPKARRLLESLDSDIDWSADAFPFMAQVSGRLAGCPVRAYRISFSGELSYEIAVPASQGLHLWQALLTAGSALGVQPYGTEALHILRAEKGFIMIGDETDGTVTPRDLGLDWALSKKKRDFIGKRALERPDMARPDRKRLVGLLTEEAQTVLPVGAYAVADPNAPKPMKTIGHVTSSYMSPTLGRSIAMALVERGPERMGETLSFPLESGVVRAKIVDPVFYDKDGERQNV